MISEILFHQMKEFTYLFNHIWLTYQNYFLFLFYSSLNFKIKITANTENDRGRNQARDGRIGLKHFGGWITISKTEISLFKIGENFIQWKPVRHLVISNSNIVKHPLRNLTHQCPGWKKERNQQLSCKLAAGCWICKWISVSWRSL